MTEPLSLSSDRQDDRDAALRALDGYLRAWDDSWGYGGRLQPAPGALQCPSTAPEPRSAAPDMTDGGDNRSERRQ